MEMKDFIDFLENNNACYDGIAFVKSCAAPQEAWQKCAWSSPMFWYLYRLQYDRRLLIRIACRCVRETRLHDGRTVWDLLTDERSRTAVELAEKWADGEDVSLEGLYNAQRANDRAQAAAYATTYDAYAAAVYAVEAAAYTAYDAAKAYDAAEAAQWKARAQQADIIREMIPEIPLPGLVTT